MAVAVLRDVPDAILSISLAASGALAIVLCSLGGWLVWRRPRAGAPAPVADLERALDELSDDVVEIVAPHPRNARAMSCSETEEHPAAALPRFMVMRSLIHPGVVTSLVMPPPQAAPKRRLRSAKGTPPPNVALGHERSGIAQPRLQRLAPVPYRGRVRRERPAR